MLSTCARRSCRCAGHHYGGLCARRSQRGLARARIAREGGSSAPRSSSSASSVPADARAHHGGAHGFALVRRTTAAHPFDEGLELEAVGCSCRMATDLRATRARTRLTPADRAATDGRARSGRLRPRPPRAAARRADELALARAARAELCGGLAVDADRCTRACPSRTASSWPRAAALGGRDRRARRCPRPPRAARVGATPGRARALAGLCGSRSSSAARAGAHVYHRRVEFH